MSSDDVVPAERCGFVLEPGDMPGDVADNYSAGSDEWYEATEAVCCWREAWDGGDGERCIWHAETDDKPANALVKARADGPERLDGAHVPGVELGDAIDFDDCGLQRATFDGTGSREASFAGVDGWGAQFTDTDLEGAQFPDADLRDAQFSDANLLGAQFSDANLNDAQFPDADLYNVQFPDADLRGAQFPHADLYNVQFPDADLRFTQFPDADLRGAQFLAASLGLAQFPDADLREAHFPDTDLTGAQFPDADLRATSFEDAHMSLRTVGDAAHFDATTVFGWSYQELVGRWGRAARSYRAFQQTLREHSMPTAARRYRIREMHMRRKAAFPSSPVEWAKLALARWTTEYGENPWRVTGTAIVVIVGCALVYPFVGGVVEPTVQPDSSTTHSLQRVVSVDLALPGWATELLVALYFSVVTFTTLGYGDLRPATAEAQAVATVESFVGALLMALLVYVLGRRVTT